MFGVPCLCDGRDDVKCMEDSCSIAGPGWDPPGNPNECRICWLRLGRPVPDAPPLITRTARFVRAKVQHKLTGSKEVPEAVKERRLSLCRTCDYFSPEDETCRHKTCGCRLKVKAAWSESQCPLPTPLWGPYVEEESTKEETPPPSI